MKEYHRNYLKNINARDDTMKRRERKERFKFYTPLANHNTRSPLTKNIRNIPMTKEYSKLTEKPMLRNTRNNNDEIFINNDNSLSLININNNRIINFDNSYNYPINNKKMVLFTERPKKLSDYILKNKTKQKIYQLIYLDENDLKYLKYADNNMYNMYNMNNISNNYNSNKDYSIKLLPKKMSIFNLNKHDKDKNKNLYNKIYNYNNKSYNNKSYDIKTYDTKSYNDNNRRYNFEYNYNRNKKYNIYTNNQNNDQLKIVKIQAMWRGYLTRKFIIDLFIDYYNMSRIINCFHKILYNHSKSKFKEFFDIISQKKKNLGIYNNNNKKIIRNKKIIPNASSCSSCISFRYRKKKNNNNNNYQKENVKKLNIIDNKNINFCIPGGQKVYAPPKNNLIIYRSKNNQIKNSPLLSFDKKRRDKIALRGKAKVIEVYAKLNDKKNLGINKIAKYIKRKNCLLYFPILFYRLRILQKVNLIMSKYNYLYNVIKIKEKLGLHQYFLKYRKNIFSKTVNQIFFGDQNKFPKKGSITNNNKKNNLKNNLNDNNLNENDLNKNNLNDNGLNENDLNKNNLNEKNLNENHLDNNNLNDNNLKEDNLNENDFNKNNINDNNLNENIIKNNLNDNNLNENDLNRNNLNEKDLNEDNINNNNLNENNLNERDLNENDINENNLIKSNNIIDKRNDLLKKLTIKKDITIKILLLKNYFNKWKNTTKNNSNLFKNRRYNNNYLNKSTEIPRKKFIKVKRIKSSIINDVSQPKFLGNRKGLMNSFDSDIIKKMKIHKLKLESGSSKEINISNDNGGNSFFIQKVASIFRKIGDKDLKYQCFNYWKKKTKENK
jgi:hypothetical protein